MGKKQPTKAEREYMGSVAALGCVACMNLGHQGTPAEIHHLLNGKGVGQRAAHERTIPLCPWHHRNGGPGNAIHSGIKTWEASHGTELKLLEQIEVMLA